MTVSDCDGQAAKTCCASPGKKRKTRETGRKFLPNFRLYLALQSVTPGTSCSKWLQQLLVIGASLNLRS